MAPVADPRAALAAALSGGDEALDLARVLLLIAAEERPDLDVDAYLGRLDALADAILPRLAGDEGPAAVLGTINGHLYRERAADRRRVRRRPDHDRGRDPGPAQRHRRAPGRAPARAPRPRLGAHDR